MSDQVRSAVEIGGGILVCRTLSPMSLHATSRLYAAGDKRKSKQYSSLYLDQTKRERKTRKKEAMLVAVCRKLWIM